MTEHASPVFDPVVDALVAKIAALEVEGYEIAGYKWGRQDLDNVPCGVVHLPRIGRTQPDERESEQRAAGQVSATDWLLTFPIDFYVDFGDQAGAAGLMAEIVTAFIVSVDQDPRLANGSAEGIEGVGAAGVPRCTDSEPFYDRAEDTRPLLGYEVLTVVPRIYLPE